MKSRLLLLAAPLVLALAAVPAATPQDGSAAPAYRVDFTLSQHQAGRASVRHFSILMSEGNGHVNASAKVPLKVGNDTVLYDEDVDLQAVMMPGKAPGTVLLKSTIGIAGVQQETPGSRPTVEHSSASAMSAVPVGRAVSLIKFDGGDGGREYELSAVVKPAA